MLTVTIISIPMNVGGNCARILRIRIHPSEEQLETLAICRNVSCILEAHLAGCEECEAKVNLLRDLLGVLGAI